MKRKQNDSESSSTSQHPQGKTTKKAEIVDFDEAFGLLEDPLKDIATETLQPEVYFNFFVTFKQDNDRVVGLGTVPQK